VIKTKTMRWAGHVALMGVKRGMYTVLVGKSVQKETGRPKCRWYDININL